MLLLIVTHLHVDRFACLLVVTVLLNRVAAILEGGGGGRASSNKKRGLQTSRFFNPILQTQFWG
jgi:hypothetical protein